MNRAITKLISESTSVPVIAREYSLFVYFAKSDAGYAARAIAHDTLSNASKVVGQWFVSTADFSNVIADLSAAGIKYAIAEEVVDVATDENLIALPSPYFKQATSTSKLVASSITPFLLSLFDIHLTKAIPRGPNN